ncbi:MAG TPA: hypothetical protein VF546_07805 [Pyrinomonadaceae bacterium]|jgi:hypothetical protein
MSNRLFRAFTFLFICAGLLAAGAGVCALLVYGGARLPSATVLLDAAAGVVCLLWLLLLLRVPWDLFFEAGDVLFEMQRARERQMEVRPDRLLYVRRLRRRTGLLAVGAHLASAGVVALVTYWARGQVGYYFAVFYVVATFFRPAARAYHFLLAKLRELRAEVTYPREDVLKLRADLAQAVADVRALEERSERLDARLGATEETDGRLRAELADVRAALERSERSFQTRLHTLSEEVERSLVKAFDNQNIVHGLTAFARLIKQA